jgi:hypothetical protein
MSNPILAKGICPLHTDKEVNLKINCNGRVYFMHGPCGCEHRYPVGMPIESATGFKPLVPRNDTVEIPRNVTNEEKPSLPVEVVHDTVTKDTGGEYVDDSWN